MSVRSRPILLKKSTMVSTAEKYAFEIEISTLSRGFRAQISRSCAQKRHFQQSVHAQLGRANFFNTIDPKQPDHAFRYVVSCASSMIHSTNALTSSRCIASGRVTT